MTPGLVVDTSALIAVTFGEADAHRYSRLLGDHRGDVAVSAATLVEAKIVAAGQRGDAAVENLAALVDAVAIEVTPVDAEQAALAYAAWRRFGKGRHPAGLNFGDCFSYALAKQLGVPLLFKGEDFPQTDIPVPTGL
ncbi:type II toxin-antitoxin system VapC family toxin [Jiangella rhizosphaerae]|uniref:Ribonuclease VapC n=1 Tax=Jiangella rhizosphaerae TaxID=2293569 RepID=A0A418KW57_9ACTN|nr:type II toxin-antitoxin system VapC family toxin [Jiangella rhizosphaerae]RIQ33701.1 type II toxin-antitoxin system VapC family toxin [Jiangella rhizosphaerae]